MVKEIDMFELTWVVNATGEIRSEVFETGSERLHALHMLLRIPHEVTVL